MFIIIDQLRADCLHGALGRHVNLPHLRDLMGDAVTFANHHSATSPCGPSRASILTGQYAMNHGSVRNGTPLPHDLPNLATEARKAGYEPLLYGYTDTSMDPRMFAADDPAMRSYEQVMPGFTEVVEMRLEESWPWRAHLASKGYDVPPFPEIFRPNGERPDDPAFYRAEDSDTAFLTDATIADLTVRPKGWFAHLTYIRPHSPLVAPAPYNKMYNPASLLGPDRPCGRKDAARVHPFNGPAAEYRSIASHVEGFPDLDDDDDTARLLRAIYLGLATEVDYHIGRVLNFLRETGQYDDTLIVVTADHGEMLGDHHIWGKMSYHDACYHTPLIIRDPERSAHFGRVFEAPTSSVDVAPTILDLIGQNAPETMDGYSLKPFLEGHIPSGWRDYSFSELDFGNPVVPTLWQTKLGLDADDANMAVLRSDTHTLVHFNGGLCPLLFDRKTGGEATNIAQDAGSEKILLEMSRAMLNHRMTHAGGRFARTLITQDGVVTVPSEGPDGPPEMRLAQVS